MDRVVAQQTADGYGLGTVTADPVVAARGEQGRMWRVDTERGPWAVKELLMRQVEDDAARDVAFQERMHDAGVPLPPFNEVGLQIVEFFGGAKKIGHDRL